MDNRDKITNEEELLKRSAPTLFGLEKRNNFKVPEGYFDALPARIQESCTARQTDPWRDKIRLYLSYKTLIPASIAAVALFFFSIVYFSSQDQPSALTAEDISTVIDSESIYLADEDVLVAAYIEQEDDQAETENTDDEIIDYLIENNIDFNSIIDEL